MWSYGRIVSYIIQFNMLWKCYMFRGWALTGGRSVLQHFSFTKDRLDVLRWIHETHTYRKLVNKGRLVMHLSGLSSFAQLEWNRVLNGQYTAYVCIYIYTNINIHTHIYIYICWQVPGVINCHIKYMFNSIYHMSNTSCTQ